MTRFFLIAIASILAMLTQGNVFGEQEPQARTTVGRTGFIQVNERTDLPVLQYRGSRGHHGQFLPDSGEITEVNIWQDGTIVWQIEPEIRRDNRRIYQATIPVEQVEAAVQKIAESFADYPVENRPRRSGIFFRLGANYSPTITIHSSQHYELLWVDHILWTFYQEHREVLQSGDNEAILTIIKGIGGFPPGRINEDGTYTGLHPAYKFDYRGLVEYYREKQPNAGLSERGNRVYGDEEILKAVNFYVADVKHLLLAVETILALVPSTEGLEGTRPTFGWGSSRFTVEMAINDGKAEFFYILLPEPPRPEPEPEPVATQTDIDFWYLKPDEGATPSNRMDALWRVSTTLSDFGIYLPEDVAIPAGLRVIQNALSDAGYTYDSDVDEERLAQAVHESGSNHRIEDRYEGNVYHSRFSILIIPEGIVLPAKEIERLPHLRYMFLGEAPKMPNGVAFVDKVGNNLIGAMASFSGSMPVPENNLPVDAPWWGKGEINIRQGEDKKWDAHADDILYSFTNFGRDSKPIDGWFSLQELKSGQNGFKDDRVFFMDAETGKIGEAAVRKNPETGGLEVRIQMKRDESLIVRIVRERVRYSEGQPTGIGFTKFETLPAWEYEVVP